jgi:outer membrane protein TolC
MLRTLFVVTTLIPAALLQADAEERLTPERAVALAVAGHPGMDVVEGELDAARAEHSLAKTGWLPRLDFTEEFARSTDPVFAFGSKLRQERFAAADFSLDALNNPDPISNAASRFSLRQNVWDAGRTRLRGRAAGLGFEAASAGGARTRDEIAFGALSAFWDSVLAGEMLQVARAAQEAAEANARLAAEQVEAGVAVPSDRMQAEVRLAEVRADRIRAEMNAEVARASLREALGLGEERAFVLDPPRLEPPGPLPPLEEQVAEALSARPDLRAVHLRVEQAGVGERMARSHRLPEIGAGAQYEWNDNALFGTDGSNWTVGASVRVPLFDGMETRARMALARAERKELEARRRSAEEWIRLEVHGARAGLFSAADRLRTAEAALDLAEEALRIVRERYAEGMAVMVELLGAEAARTQAQGSRAGAERDLALASASLDMAMGRALARTEHGPREGD